MIVSLAEAAKLGPELAGSKGASLARMAAQGFPIPTGVVVTADEFDAFLGDQLSSGHGDLQELTRRVKGNSRSLWACRSSATVEDGQNASYAGRFRTYLNISSAELQRHVRLCWKSALSGEVESYRDQIRDLRHVRMAVVVQEMVPAVVSGVAFASDDELVLESSWGLGEAIVGGLTEPDRWVFGRGELSLKRSHIGRKQVRLFSPPSRRKRNLFGDTLRHPATGRDYSMVVHVTDHVVACIPANFELAASRACLGADRVAEIAALCQRVAVAQGGPQDIEWAWDGAQFYILQSRPITRMVSGRSDDTPPSADSLRGLGVSAGSADGPPRVVWNEEDLAQVGEGDILVAFQTQPSYMEALTRCWGVVTETGGLLSHAAIVCRELGKPCVAGVPEARTRLANIATVAINGLSGTVQILERGHQPSPDHRPNSFPPSIKTLPAVAEILPWRV